VVVKRLFVCFVYCAVAAGCGSGAGKKTTGTGGAGGVGGVGGSTGSAGTSGSCTFTACGGDLVGTWNVESLCSPNPSVTCPPYDGVTIDRSASVATYTFAANGTFTYAASGTLTETLRYPKDCLSPGADAGVSELCAAFQAAVQSSIAKADGGSLSGLTSFTCSVENNFCVCVEVFTNLSVNETGTYTTSGNQLTITITGGSTADGGFPNSDYCVSGSTLKIRSPSTEGDVVTKLTKR